VWYGVWVLFVRMDSLGRERRVWRSDVNISGGFSMGLGFLALCID
jgi:hypothetical protein